MVVDRAALGSEAAFKFSPERLARLRCPLETLVKTGPLSKTSFRECPLADSRQGVFCLIDTKLP